MATAIAIAEKGLASLSTEQLLDLYAGAAEAYGVASMWNDQELLEHSKELLRQLNEVFESRS